MLCLSAVGYCQEIIFLHFHCIVFVCFICNVRDCTKQIQKVVPCQICRVPERLFESATQAGGAIFIVIFSSHLLCFATLDWYINCTASSVGLLEWLRSRLNRPLARAEESSSAVGGTSLVGESFLLRRRETSLNYTWRMP